MHRLAERRKGKRGEDETNLLLFVLVHLAESQEVFDQEHEVNSAQRCQALPHTVQVLLWLLVLVLVLVLVVVVVISLSLQSAYANRPAQCSNDKVSAL